MPERRPSGATAMRACTNEPTGVVVTQPEWPYDAEQGEWAEKYRIPVVGSPYPGWMYHLALVVSDFPWEGVRPSEAEVKALAVALDELLSWYNDTYRER